MPLALLLAIVVTRFTDSFDGHCDTDCSLREAVQLANATPGESRIVLRPGTYQLTLPPPTNEDGIISDEDANANGDLDIRGQLVLVGAGVDKTTIDANRIDRALQIHPGAAVQISGLTIRNGRQTDHAGAIDIRSGATLLLRSCGITNNIAGGSFDAAGYAGAIANAGTLTVESCRIDGNQSARGERPGRSYGGAIYNTGTLTVRETQFINNTARDHEGSGFGGALFNSGTAWILRSSFEGNGTGFAGAGTTILNKDGGTLRMENTTVTTGSESDDSAEIGAVANGMAEDSVPAVMKLINVTSAGNFSHGLLNFGKLDVLDSIIAGNGTRRAPQAVEQNCLNNGPNARFTQRGLLRGTDDFTNCEADIVVPNATVFTSVLYPLALNNWVTPTFALRPHSPAVDAAVAACPSTDQRRVTRPRDGNGDGVAICDLGAYERPKP
jgi:CSLREA domain-containing protein